jgi:signal transduction histidine kinase
LPVNTRFMLRLTAPVVATSLLLLGVGVGAAWYVQRLQKSVSDDLRANVSGMRAAEELEIVVREFRTQLDHFAMTGDRKYLDAVADFDVESERWLVEAERWSLTSTEQRLMDRVRRGHREFLRGLEQIQQPASREDAQKRARVLLDTVLTREVLDPTHQFLDFNEDEVEQSIAENQFFANRLVWGLLLLGTCGSVAGLVAGFGLARGFRRSLVQLSVPIRAAAEQLDEVVGPVTFAGGDLEEMETVMRQIAQRIREVVERLRRSEQEALHAEQLAAVGQMAAGMAHELRNPLTSMKILVQAAQDGGALEGRDLGVLEEEITRLERLVRSILDFARPPRPEKKVLDVRPLVDESVALFAARAAGSGIRLVFHRPPDQVRAAVDPAQFRQVLLNLVVNALDAVAAGGCVMVDLEQAGGGLTLRVSDTGCGLPAHLGERIFAPFMTTKETGLGLGLSICRRIAEAHGGTITGTNRPEGGAVFTLNLPVVATQESGVRNADPSEL